MTKPTTNSTSLIWSNLYSRLNLWHPWNWMARENNVKASCSSLLYAVYYFFLFTSRTSLWETTSCVLFCITAHSIKSQSGGHIRPVKYAGVTGIETSLSNTRMQLVSAAELRRCRVGFTFRYAWERCLRKTNGAQPAAVENVFVSVFIWWSNLN